MKFTDRVLQRWRIAKVRRYISPGARILDIGSADGALFQRLAPVAAGSMGIDPTLKENITEVLINAVLCGKFKPGDHVSHARFGEGRIEKCRHR